MGPLLRGQTRGVEKEAQVAGASHQSSALTCSLCAVGLYAHWEGREESGSCVRHWPRDLTQCDRKAGLWVPGMTADWTWK